MDRRALVIVTLLAATSTTTSACDGPLGATNAGTPDASSLPARVVSDREADWVAVDATHIYFSTLEEVARVPKTGGPLESLASAPLVDRYSPVAYGLSADSIFFGKNNGLAQMPKQGGAITMLVATGYPYLSFFAADEGGVAAVNGYGLMRCDSNEPCTFTSSVNGGHRIAMDKDWVYYRRNVVSDDMLVRSARRAESSETFDTLDEKVGPFGFIVTDDTRIYFTRPTKDPSFGESTSIVWLPKEPGGTPVVLVDSSGISSQGGGLVDDFWIYWVRESKILAVPKNGPPTTPIVVGTSCRDQSAPATDGQRLYWPSTEGGIDSAPVPKRP